MKRLCPVCGVAVSNLSRHLSRDRCKKVHSKRHHMRAVKRGDTAAVAKQLGK